jgi:hypothetical protein
MNPLSPADWQALAVVAPALIGALGVTVFVTHWIYSSTRKI